MSSSIAEVAEFASSVDDFFNVNCHSLPNRLEKMARLTEQAERAIENLNAIPIEKRQLQDDKAMHLYKREKLHLTEALKCNHYMVDAWICLGTCIWKRGDLDKAKRCFRKGLELDPKNKELLLQLSLLERRQCLGETEVENPEEIIGESIKHAKEAITLDVQDGMSWYALGNACLTAYFVTGTWDHDMLMQSLKAFRNAGKDEKLKFCSELCYNRSMTYKFLENYEAALAGFEAAGLMDPGLNALEQALYLYEILDEIAFLLQLPSPTSSLPTVDSLASPLASVELNPSYEKSTVDHLTEGYNQGKAVTGKVLFSVKNPSTIPIYYVVCDSDCTCLVLTVYGICSTAIKEEDQVTLLDPFYRSFDFESKGKHYQFKSVRLDLLQQLHVNGAAVSAEHVIHRSMYPQLKEA